MTDTRQCCGNEAWRGRLCDFHRGVEEGIDFVLEATRGLDGVFVLPDDIDDCMIPALRRLVDIARRKGSV